MICLLDSKCNCLICSLVFKFVSLFPTRYNRLSAYQLQKSATEPTSTCHCINFYTICWLYLYRLQINRDYKKNTFYCRKRDLLPSNRFIYQNIFNFDINSLFDLLSYHYYSSASLICLFLPQRNVYDVDCSSRLASSATPIHIPSHLVTHSRILLLLLAVIKQTNKLRRP
jgi:hypothetical protein